MRHGLKWLPLSSGTVNEAIHKREFATCPNKGSQTFNSLDPSPVVYIHDVLNVHTGGRTEVISEDNGTLTRALESGVGHCARHYNC